MDNASPVKRIVVAEGVILLALSAAQVGYFLLGFLGLPESGRDPLPLFGVSALAMVAAGAAVGRTLHPTLVEHLMIPLPWIVLLYGIVAMGTGLVVPDLLFLGWFAAGLLVLLLPWSIGVLLGQRGGR